MGNHQSTSTPFRRGNALGLSKAELDKRCKPSGLYPSWQWDNRAVRRLIGDGKLAARLDGSDSRESSSHRECPICFLHYSQINMTQCCHATICTECYLQVRPQREKHCSCPFCNNPKIVVRVAKNLNECEVAKRDKEEQKVIEATIRARGSKPQTNDKSIAGNSPDSTDSSSQFGANLENRIRSRTSSDGENLQTLSQTGGNRNLDEISSLALSPEERRALEEEMRAQSSHPLSRQIQREAEEERNRHETEHLERNLERLRNSRYERDMLLLRAHGLGFGTAGAAGRSGRMARMERLASDPNLVRDSSIGRRSRDWNQFVNAFDDVGNGDGSNLDDLVVIEAALLLSMEEEASRRRSRQQQSARHLTSGSMTNNDQHSLENNDNENELNANERALSGFPLIQALMAQNRSRNSEGNHDDEDEDNDDENDSEDFHDLARRSSRRRLLLSRNLQRPSNSYLDSAGMLMGGITEDEQVAMAIAMSLRDSAPPSTSPDNENSLTDDAGDSNHSGSGTAGAVNNLSSDATQESSSEQEFAS